MSEPVGNTVRLACDEMLLGIGRWLRVAGYDTAIATAGMADAVLIAHAEAERRVLLTCDRRLAARAPQIRVVALATEGLDAAALELRERLGIDWLYAPFTRCLVDNVPLRPADPADLHRIPESSRMGPGPIRTCPECGRVYWPGSHVRRMRARLEHWQSARPDPGSAQIREA